jgi:hypothetical protein
MWWCVAIALANPATPDPAFYRHGDALTSRRYTKISEGAGPAKARLRNGDGEFLAWVFRDGVVEHYERYQRQRLVESGTFDAHGERVATVKYAGGAPAQVVVAGADAQPLAVTGWVEHRVVAPPPEGSRHGTALVLRVPAPPDTDPAAWTVAEGVFRAGWGPAGDVWSDGFRTGLGAGCGCTVVDRATTWVGGREGVRYLVEIPGSPSIGEVWAVPVPGGTVVASFTAPLPDPDPFATGAIATPLAAGRAIVAIARWESS